MSPRLSAAMLSLKNTVNHWSFRERMLLLIAGVVVIYILLSEGFIAPLQQDILQAQQENDNLQKQITTLHTNLNRLALGSNHPISTTEKNQLQEQKTALQQLTTHLISPQSIPNVLEQMVNQFSGLTLVNMQTNENAGADETQEKSAVLPRYQIRLTLTGEYYQLLQYIKRIEALSYPLIWEELDYKVIQFPKAQIVIKWSMGLDPTLTFEHEGV